MAAPNIPKKPFPNKIGDKFGMLTIIASAESLDKRNKTAWLCRCECGVEKVFRQSNLRMGTRSCGCVRRATFFKYNTTHGQSGSITYGSWLAMKQRCCNPNHKKYPSYGGRGIKICGRWLKSFENFFADMGTRPTANHTIDRINPDGNYEPDNCRWLLQSAQQRNKKATIKITINGETKSLSDWCDIYGIKYYLAANRIKLGWEIQEALTEPADAHRKQKRKAF